MIANKNKFYQGIALIASFFVVLVLFFSPIFNGHNGLEYLDELYNSISKGSAYYIPDVKKEVDPFSGTQVTVDLDLMTAENARQTALLFSHEASVQVSGALLHVSGDLAKILNNSLADADLMYHNNGRQIAHKYGYDERQVVYNWWKALGAMNKALTKQEHFKLAKVVHLVQNKAVETAYNYYTIEPRHIGGMWGIVVFSLVFYVAYTLWYGFAIMFMFEGIGMQLEH
jgi:hypothetical protein